MAAGDRILFEWLRVVRRADLSFGEGKKKVSAATVQHIAVVAATYGNPDGTRVRPSEARLARVCRRDVKTVRDCLKRLREVGLMVRVFEGSSAGRGGMADEYELAIPDDLGDRVPMLDPDERRLITPEGVDAPPVKSRGPRTPGAAPADPAVDDSSSPGAAPGDDELPVSNDRVLPPGTPGAAPRNTGCSTRPPTQHLPDTSHHAHTSPYGADVEGGPTGRREPSAKDHKEAKGYQPPLLFTVPSTPEAASYATEPDPAAYEAARAELARLPDLGSELIAAARAELGESAGYARLVIRARQILDNHRREVS
ncbi:hypothetical protein [Nonomuraea sp. NPDC049758]|uniref:hypothetical protein n=1 Tax=Nonomuraea sp. NPDC049758 TaxID=3154360 RepID=UPI00342E7822